MKPRDIVRVVGVEPATRRALLYFVVPLWLGAGLADWYQHRKTHIEKTAGARESAIHLLMLLEAGVPSLIGLFFEINAGVLAIAYGALVAHDATAIWDMSYAEVRRRVTTTEQHIHSFLESSPVMAVTFLTVLHWDQVRALLGMGRGWGDFRLRPNRPPLGPRYVVGLIAAIVFCGVVPYVEEFWRCYRQDPTLAPKPAPPVPATPTLALPT